MKRFLKKINGNCPYKSPLPKKKFKIMAEEKYHFFWESGSPFSQFHSSPFKGTSEYGGEEENFRCAEQWMMYNKALLFEDHKTAQEILQVTKPGQMKALGRQVSGFKNSKWDKHKLKIVKRGSKLKFSQNLHLKKALLNTTGILVEASPSDTIWGIGLSAKDPRAKSKATWRGLNLLGYILTEVRDEFIDSGNVNDVEELVIDEFLPEILFNETNNDEEVYNNDKNNNNNNNNTNNNNNNNNKRNNANKKKKGNKNKNRDY